MLKTTSEITIKISEEMPWQQNLGIIEDSWRQSGIMILSIYCGPYSKASRVRIRLHKIHIFLCNHYYRRLNPLSYALVHFFKGKK